MGKAAATLAIAISIVAAFFGGWNYSQQNYPVVVTKTIVRQPVAPSAAVQAFAQSICDGTPKVDSIDPNGFVTENQLAAYSSRYAARSYTCGGISYLGTVRHPVDGSTDEIYSMTVGGQDLWYIFTFTKDGLISDIQ